MQRERTGQIHIKGNMDVEIAVDIVNACRWAETIVLFSGDGDFAYALEYARKQGKTVIVYSTGSGSQSEGNVASDLLRRTAHLFIDYAKEEMNWLTTRKEHTEIT